MRIGDFTISYIGHTSFLFRSPGGTVILTEPLFSRGFEWQGKYETYLSPPRIAIEEITPCDAIFVSHIHGDHCDRDALAKIHQQTKARILAPEDVLDLLGSGPGALPEDAFVHIEDAADAPIGDVHLTPLAGYDRSFDKRKRPNKFSLILRTGQTSLFFSGDCHQVPPGLVGQQMDAILWWPYQDDQKLLSFCRSLKFSRFVLMHGDRFRPGNFLCNLDYSKEKRRIQKLLPDVEIIIPERIRKLE